MLVPSSADWMVVVENCRTHEVMVSFVRAKSSREVPPDDLNRAYIVCLGASKHNWLADVWLLGSGQLLKERCEDQKSGHRKV